MSKKWKWVVAITLFLIMVICIITFLFKNPFIVIKLNDKKQITLEVNSVYNDPGVTIKYFGKNNNSKVKKTSFSTKKIGTYNIKYTVKKFFTSKQVIRKVNVVDTTSPIIVLKGSPNVILPVGQAYNEPGYDASDLYDGVITDKVKVENSVNTLITGNYKVVYSVMDSSKNEARVERNISVIKYVPATYTNAGYENVIMGPKYIKGILIVNKKYALPNNYGKGDDPVARESLRQLQSAASVAGFSMPLLSGYRSYQVQVNLYQKYVNKDGQKVADRYSARAGHSEHQTGLAFDVGKINNGYGDTPAGKWLVQNCAKYGFILRYLKGKETITGYKYEPWHIRYVGPEISEEIMNKNITLEEYLEIN